MQGKFCKIMAIVLACLVVDSGRAETLLEYVESSAERIISGALETGDLDKAEAALKELRDQVIAFAPETDLWPITEASRAEKMVAYANDAGSVAVLRAMLKHEEVASHLVFAWRSSRDNESIGGQLLLRLAAERGPQIDRFPALAAALVLVHDLEEGLVRNINENQAHAIDPVQILDHFVTYEKQLAINPTQLPVELLFHVVNTTSTAEDLAYAVNKFGRRPDPGSRFFEIDYDYAHYSKGTKKALTQSGRFDLRAIEELGGVCADQAYYAEEVGKACGMPTAYVVAKGADVSHAWIGYLEFRGRRSQWNTDAGRYDAYQNLRGDVWITDRTWGQSDAQLKLTAGLIGVPERDRWTAAAVSDVVWDWSTARRAPKIKPIPELYSVRSKPRVWGDMQEMQSLLRAGIEASPFMVDGWIVIANLGKRGLLDEDAMHKWGTALDRLCGRAYADFSVWVLSMMIEGVEDTEEQLRLWEWVHSRFGRRPDIASDIRMAQASLCIANDDNERAWWALQDVIGRYGGDAPDVVRAAEMTVTMLEDKGLRDQVPSTLKDIWGRIPKPRQAGGSFRTQSNWFRIGRMYLKAVERTDPAEADRARKKLGL